MKGYMSQEIEVWYIIPAIRSQIAKDLLKLKLKQKDIAEILGVTEAAISQYIKKKRASGISFDAATKKEIMASSQSISKNKKTISAEINRIIKLLKKTEFVCKIHAKHGNNEKNCKLCKC